MLGEATDPRQVSTRSWISSDARSRGCGTPRRGRVREVAEETGLQVAVDRLVGVYSEPAFQVFCYPDGRVVQFVTTSFAYTHTGGRLLSDGVECVAAAGRS